MNLIEFLKENENTRKIFGRAELSIIEKQVNGFELSQSEKNRLSRDIRKKFEFIKEANQFKDSFRLEKNHINKNIVKKAVDIILKDEISKKIDSVLLFGSFADNTFTPWSDIDICVVFKEISLREATEFRIRVLGEVSEKVDIQVFNNLPQKVKSEIIKNHKVLHQNKRHDDFGFSIKHLKNKGYTARMQRIFGAS